MSESVWYHRFVAVILCRFFFANGEMRHESFLS